MCDYMYATSLTKKQIRAKILNLILQLYYMQMLLEIFYEGLTNSLCTGAHKIIRIYYMVCGRNFLLVNFNALKFHYI